MESTEKEIYYQKVDKAAKKFGRSFKRPFLAKELYTGFVSVTKEKNWCFNCAYPENLCIKKRVMEHKEKVKDWTLVENWLESHHVENSERLFVDTEEQLLVLVEKLQKETLLAISVERSIDHGFLGPYLCVLIISTPKVDYIIDVIKLSSEVEACDELKEKIFFNANILKIFFAATEDILALHQDLSTHVLGIIDLQDVHELLFGEKPANFSAAVQKLIDKEYVKETDYADWTIRPLPDKMIEYAGNDTHLMLKCWEVLKTKIKITTGIQISDIKDHLIANGRQLSSLYKVRTINDYETAVIKHVVEESEEDETWHWVVLLLDLINMHGVEHDLPNEKVLSLEIFINAIDNKRIHWKVFKEDRWCWRHISQFKNILEMSRIRAAGLNPPAPRLQQNDQFRMSKRKRKRLW